MSIATAVREYLAKFKQLDGSGGVCESSNIGDQHGRFRVWAGNISAHRTGRRSLEYRLRDSSNLQRTVINLLEDLKAVLERLSELTAQQYAGTEDAGLPPLPAHEDEADDENDAELFGLDEDESSSHALYEQALEEAHEVITCLMRFSMTLRNPARHDQLKQAAATTTKHFEPHDIKHVREKYPDASGFLHRRLGKAISRQRQYFKYREEHHQKLSEGLDDRHEERDERPSTIATSLVQSEKAVAQLPVADLADETESVYTATSFAPTTAGTAALKPPPLPEAGRNGEPFECLLCYGMVVAEDQRSWRQHIYEDLPPYVCTYEHCLSADHRYSRRRDWQRHQSKFHHRHWVCPFGCSGPIASETELLEHLETKHDQILDKFAAQRIAEGCAVPDELADLTCPLCMEVMPSPKRWFKHLGHHLEQFALHALPQHVLSADSDDEPSIVDDSEDDDVEVPFNEMKPGDDDKEPGSGINTNVTGLYDGSVYPNVEANPVADKDLTQWQKDGALLAAAADGHLDRVDHLLRLGARIDYADGRGLTALQYAAYNGFEDIVKFLLSIGAKNEVNLEEWSGATPLRMALMKQRPNIVGLLRRDHEESSSRGRLTQALSTSKDGQVSDKSNDTSNEESGGEPEEDEHTRDLAAGGLDVVADDESTMVVDEAGGTVDAIAYEVRDGGPFSALDATQPFRALCQSRMDSLPRGDRVLPPCDRCRRLWIDCIKDENSCIGCTKKQARCHWRVVSREELHPLAGGREMNLDKTQAIASEIFEQTGRSGRPRMHVEASGDDRSPSQRSRGSYIVSEATHRPQNDRRESLYERETVRLGEDMRYKNIEVRDRSQRPSHVDDDERATSFVSTVQAEPGSRDTSEILRDYKPDIAILERSRSLSRDASNRWQHQPATFQCPHCPKRFIRAYNLPTHLRTHNRGKPFLCSVCGQAFSRQNDRRRHENLHIDNRDHDFLGKGPPASEYLPGRPRSNAQSQPSPHSFIAKDVDGQTKEHVPGVVDADATLAAMDSVDSAPADFAAASAQEHTKSEKPEAAEDLEKEAALQGVVDAYQSRPDETKMTRKEQRQKQAETVEAETEESMTDQDNRTESQSHLDQIREEVRKSGSQMRQILRAMRTPLPTHAGDGTQLTQKTLQRLDHDPKSRQQDGNELELTANAGSTMLEKSKEREQGLEDATARTERDAQENSGSNNQDIGSISQPDEPSDGTNRMLLHSHELFDETMERRQKGKEAPEDADPGPTYKEPERKLRGSSSNPAPMHPLPPKTPGHQDFLSQKAPENYVAGLGHGTPGFTTATDPDLEVALRKPFTCTVCGERFKNEDDRKLHNNRHAVEEAFAFNDYYDASNDSRGTSHATGDAEAARARSHSTADVVERYMALGLTADDAYEAAKQVANREETGVNEPEKHTVAEEDVEDILYPSGLGELPVASISDEVAVRLEASEGNRSSRSDVAFGTDEKRHHRDVRGSLYEGDVARSGRDREKQYKVEVKEPGRRRRRDGKERRRDRYE